MLDTLTPLSTAVLAAGKASVIITGNGQTLTAAFIGESRSEFGTVTSWSTAAQAVNSAVRAAVVEYLRDIATETRPSYELALDAAIQFGVDPTTQRAAMDQIDALATDAWVRAVGTGPAVVIEVRP